jgi:hypothetical protein
MVMPEAGVGIVQGVKILVLFSFWITFLPDDQKLRRSPHGKDLLTLHSLHYHKLHGTKRYSIDANARASKWRITFAWTNQELTDVSLVKVEDTH